MEEVNGSIKNVSKAVELLKKYLELNDIANERLVEDSIKLLEKSVEMLVDNV